MRQHSLFDLSVSLSSASRPVEEASGFVPLSDLTSPPPPPPLTGIARLAAGAVVVDSRRDVE